MRSFARSWFAVVSLVQATHPALGGPPSLGEAAQRSLPSVVSIHTSRPDSTSTSGGTNVSVGSGVIIKSDGLIITSHHVIEGASELSVSLLGDPNPYPARLIAGDASSDVAVIQLEKATGQGSLPTLIPLKMGDSDRLKVGDPVIAVGNPFGFKHSVTAGIVSARGRNGSSIGAMAGSPGESGPEIEDLIQTDAAINPGNSGGPLLNAHGEMIGLNAAIFSQNGGFIGIGFAIPSRVVRELSEELLRNGKITRGWVGVTAQNLDPNLAAALRAPHTQGALISDTKTGGPASRAGIQSGDILLKIEGSPIRDSVHLKQLVSKISIGRKVEVELARRGKIEILQVVVEQRSATKPSPAQENSVKHFSRSHPKTAKDLGLAFQNLPQDLRGLLELPKQNGVLVSQVTPGSQAAEAGLSTGDVILEFNQSPAENADALERGIQAALTKKENPGPLLLLVQRGPGDRIFLALRAS